MDSIPKIPPLLDLDLPQAGAGTRPTGTRGAFTEALAEAVQTVDQLQHDSESAQIAFSRNEGVELHDVLIKIEQAEVAFKTMMEIRNKLVESYREIMRMGG